jgi:predicted glutamine amidotransferase
MCRLFAWHSETPISLAHALGQDAPSLTTLSELHGDGWGIAFGDGSVVREPIAVKDSTDFADASQKATTDAIVHLRWATENLSVCLPNTHPFVKDTPVGQVAFIHNGGLARGEQLNALIDDDLQENYEGDTDSEQYFAALITAMRRTDGDVADAYRLLLKDLVEVKHSSLNAMLLTPTDIWVLSRHIPANRPESMPEDYYTLTWRIDDDGVFSAWSTEVRAGTGNVLGDGDLLQLERATGTVIVHRVM